MYEQYLPQKEKNLTLEQASLLVQGWQVHSSEGTGRGWVWCVPVWGCRELALCTLLARLILCSSGLWSDLWELQPRGHTSPSWSALLTPCHILVGLRNSLFLFELIRTQEKENGKKKVFSLRPWERLRGWNVDVEHGDCAFPSNAALHRHVLWSQGSLTLRCAVLVAPWKSVSGCEEFLFAGMGLERGFGRSKEGKGVVLQEMGARLAERSCHWKVKWPRALGECKTRGDFWCEPVSSKFILCTACFSGKLPCRPLPFDV